MRRKNAERIIPLCIFLRMELGMPSPSLYFATRRRDILTLFSARLLHSC